MFAGLTAANVLGVPLGTLLGQQLGWRSTFWAITIIGIITLVGIRLLVPPTAAPTETSLRSELGAFRRPQVWISVALWVGAGVTVAGLVVPVAGSVWPRRRVPGAAPTGVTRIVDLEGRQEPVAARRP
jgi:DHA1 family inner membrane transport protein